MNENMHSPNKNVILLQFLLCLNLRNSEHRQKVQVTMSNNIIEVTQVLFLHPYNLCAIMVYFQSIV